MNWAGIAVAFGLLAVAIAAWPWGLLALPAAWWVWKRC